MAALEKSLDEFEREFQNQIITLKENAQAIQNTIWGLKNNKHRFIEKDIVLQVLNFDLIENAICDYELKNEGIGKIIPLGHTLNMAEHIEKYLKEKMQDEVKKRAEERENNNKKVG